MTRAWERLGLRGRLVLSVLAALAALLATLVVGYNLILYNRLEHEINAILGARVHSGLSRVHVVDGRVVVGQPAGDGGPDTPVWIFADGRTLSRPDADPRADRFARGLAGGPRRHAELEATDQRFLAVPVFQDDPARATVVTSVSRVSYEHIQKVVLVTSLLLALLVLGAVTLATRWVVARALRPVASMTAQADEWSEHDLERRFAHGPPHDELTQLAATLDALLDRVATALRHEQLFSAEASHELRTPLAGIVAEAQLALRHPHTPEQYRAGFERVLEIADQMRATLATLLATAQGPLQSGSSTSPASEGALAARRTCSGLAQRRELDLSVEVAEEVRVGAAGEVVERILAPLLENACRHARNHVRIAVAAQPGAVLYTVVDDGPGVLADEHEAIFEPGVRGAARIDADQGTGLGLALARRLARRAGGDVHAVPDPEGGRFVVRLPRG